jgi:hypothetical protein
VNDIKDKMGRFEKLTKDISDRLSLNESKLEDNSNKSEKFEGFIKKTEERL